MDALNDRGHRFRGTADRLRSADRLALMEIDKVLALSIDSDPIGNVLDVGTGSGVFAEAFHKRGLDVSGIDANPEMIAEAQKHIPEGSFLVGMAEALPYPDHAFDLVFLGHVLHEAEDALLVLREAHRVAGIRVGILEWPYRESEKGPPLTHRLSPESVLGLAMNVGFSDCQVIHLEHMDYYRLGK